jgi:sugar lactone lactonase YvrE
MKFERLADGYVFLEAPRTDREGNLFFSDIVIGGIFRRAPDGAVTHLLADRKMIGGLALNADGRLVVSGGGGLILFDVRSGEREALMDTADGRPVGGVNDLQPDGEGGLYAGTVDAAAQAAMVDNDPAVKLAASRRPAEPQPLVLLSADRRARCVGVGAVITNGIGLSPDRRVLYQAETLEGILAYDRAPDGTLSKRRLAIRHPFSDGIAVDSEGCIWIAAVQDGAIVRFTPEGKLDRRIDVPVREVASLTFGGEDLRDLYVVTGSAINRPSYARTGHVYRARSDVAGLATPLTRF